MKVLFFGNYPISLAVLNEVRRHASVCGIITRPHPDNPVLREFRSGEIPLFEAEKAALALPFAQEADPDLLLCVSYSSLIPQTLLSLAPAYNLHPSLLPRWRGPDPIRRALYHGDAEFGVSLHEMEAAFDRGRVVLSQRIAIGPGMTLKEATAAATEAGVQLVRTLLLSPQSLRPTPQEESQASWAAPLQEELAHRGHTLDPSTRARLLALLPSPYEES